MVLFILVNGKMESDTVKVPRPGLMGQDMKGNGLMIGLVEKEN
jgi:hypothetical protein